MRRALVLFAVLLTLGSAALAADGPALRIVSTRPFQVRGVGFKPAERVTVRLRLEGKMFLRVDRATSAGSFTAKFKDVLVGRCSAWLLTARGNRGSRAALRPSPFVDCPQP